MLVGADLVARDICYKEVLITDGDPEDNVGAAFNDDEDGFVQATGQ